MRTLVWLRADLRTRDNTALHEASVRSDRGVVCLFVVSPAEWRAHDWGAPRVDFVLRNLGALSEELAALNIPLRIAHAAEAKDVPGAVVREAMASGCDAVHWNVEHEVDERRRDERVKAALSKAGIGAVEHSDQTILPPGELRTGAGGFYTVFTPFKKSWLRTISERGAPPALPAPRKQARLDVGSTAPPRLVEGFETTLDPALWPAGEGEALARLKRFTAERLGDYAADRDYPAREGTSALSPYLAVGAISARQCLDAALGANDGRAEGGRKGAATWISELIWREFYRSLLVGYPRVCMNRALKPATDRIEWSCDTEQFERWRRGKTGFPIVDSAMRCLAKTGWMHNRLRMIVAMFLTKDLFIDWRWGERWFMNSLVDGDFASNNGGWQWSASTGADAAPYFRIFNPTHQSRRFDPDGRFIRTWTPELAELNDRQIHEPGRLPPLAKARLDYPEPMVDHRAARDRVMRAFQELDAIRRA